MPKVLVVGLDGATWDVIRPLAAAGRLPNLQRIMATGAAGPLRSTIPPVTPAAWTSVFTGKNPGKHGILDFQELDRETYVERTVRTDQNREKTIWQLLGEAGRRSIVMDVPFTYPPRPLNGMMLTGYGTPRRGDNVFTYPADFAARLPAELRAEVRVALPAVSFDRSQAFIDDWQAVMRGRERLLGYLIEEEAWDFFMVVFSITDNMAHVFWTFVDPAHPNYRRPEGAAFREAFFHAYELCDRLLGQLSAAAGPDTTTLVLSDHGFGSVRPRQYIFKRLLEGGYVTPGSDGRTALSEQLMRLAVATYTRFPRLREWAKNLRPGRRRVLKQQLQRAGMMPGAGNIDYSRSRIVPSNFGLRMWVNEEGTFGQGIVPPEEKEALLQELRDFLLADRDPVTGQPIIANVYRGSELYQGANAEKGPDLVIEYANAFDPGQAAPAENPHVEGGHTLQGIFLAQGPGVQKATPQEARLIDLAPTVLYLLDQPVPPDMDGRVLVEILDERFLQDHPVQAGRTPARYETMGSGSGYSEEEDADIREQLRQLGYIE